MSLFSGPLAVRTTALLAHCRAHGVKIATAESCTGGLVAALLTEIAGASDVFERGFITYSNAAKTGLLGVARDLITREGAVSAAVARAMAEGALDRSAADLSVAVTGIAGPGGGSAEKPVGLVWFAIARRGAGAETVEKRFGDLGRSRVRLKAVETALDLLLAASGTPR